MLPYIHLGSLTIPTFGLFLWLGGVAAAYLLHRNFVRNGVKADAISVVAVAMIAGVVGAKAWHELQNPAVMMRALHQVAEPGWHHPLEVLGGLLSWFREGFAWFGGLVAGVAVLMYQGHIKYDGIRAGAVRMLDLAAPAAALGYGVGRIGCLTSGDGDYGIATTLPWGVHIKDTALDPPRPNPPGLLVHPTPIYELLFGIALAAYLWMRGKKNIPIGQLTGEYLIISGIGRFLVEFIRRNPRLYYGMSNAQVAALLSSLAGVLLIAVARARNRRPVEAEATAA
ncbi:MAG: prolipoprotein diacylglyceryl transferase [Acidobacteria bacterium]|nr:prolipoprotein diacylglyceryl transferase [Acidobacteriota bacterium]